MADMTGLDAQFRTRFGLAVQAIERELGIAVSVVSAYRSRAEQARLYDAWLRKQRGEPGYGWANLAAPPGKSNHEHGLAIDITPNSTPAMREVFWRYGLTFPVKGEPWHVEPITARGGTYPPLPGPKPAPKPPTEDDVYVRYNLTGQTPGVWLVSPVGRFAPPADLLGAIEKSGAVKYTVDCDAAASQQFIDGHPG
jgi:hypothetical protein